jgi:hypothetical protein
MVRRGGRLKIIPGQLIVLRFENEQEIVNRFCKLKVLNILIAVIYG